jgi:hypothetical protein
VDRGLDEEVEHHALHSDGRVVLRRRQAVAELDELQDLRVDFMNRFWPEFTD